MGGTTQVVMRWRTVACGAAVVAAAAALAWALAYPQSPFGFTLARAVVDVAAVLTLGLAVVPWLDVERYRRELAERAAGPLIVASAVWAVAELVRLPLDTAQAAGVPVLEVGASTTLDFVVNTAAGRSGVLCAAAAMVVCGAATVAQRTPAVSVVIAGAAAVGLTARTLVGHVSADEWGGMAVAVHALAAALWCGGLAALVLTVDRRGQWARVLPRFSRMSLVCVAVLVVGGTAGALVAVASPADLWSTGYGRLLSVKILLTALLTVLAWRNRTVWLPAARTHRSTADGSALRSRIELAGMAVALTLAAALAVTG